MSQKKKGSVAPNQPLRPTASKISTSPDVTVAKTARVINTEDLLFSKENFKWIFIGMGVMLLGFILMSGGSMPDANTWDPNIIYSFRRITLAPFLILAGIVIEIYAIFINKK
ncbi:MAG: DUF3098 domain-containing protein [Saprospiraceae bacterium]|nr:DUF3098 domain-containing protein [Candidatus Brachybacter algidus]